MVHEEEAKQMGKQIECPSLESNWAALMVRIPREAVRVRDKSEVVSVRVLKCLRGLTRCTREKQDRPQ